MDSYHVFQAAVLAQPFLWMWLYRTDLIHVREGFIYLYTIIGVCTARLIQLSSFSVEYYTTPILLQYIYMTIMATWIFNIRYNVQQSISLAFLTVYLNSFYWEMPLHLAELIQTGPQIHMLSQLLRLTPLIFFLREYSFTHQSIRTLVYGYTVSLLIIFTKIFSNRILDYTAGHSVLTTVNRFVCAVALTKAVMEAQKHELQ